MNTQAPFRHFPSTIEGIKMHPLTEYLIVVMPRKAKPNGGLTGAGSYTVADPPTVHWVKAQNEKHALGMVQIAPGGHAFIAAENDIKRFNKAEEAPLEEVSRSGQPFPMAEAVV